MKTINFILSKRLNEGGFLYNINTEYFYSMGEIYKNKGDNKNISIKDNVIDGQYIKTLTLEEAIEFLPKRIGNYHLQLNLYGDICGIRYVSAGYSLHSIEAETLLEAIEKVITYLLDNNLLTK